VHVGTFLREAAEAGLLYLGDAIPATTALELLPPAVGERVRGRDVAEVQQVADFVRNTAFRRALLVRADTASTRGWQWPSRLDAGAIEGLRVASRLRARAGSPQMFEAGELCVQVVDESARRALGELAAVAPRALPFDELAQRCGAAAEEGRSALATELLDVALATGAVDLHVIEPPIVVVAGHRPKACPVARWHAARGGAITNAWHQEVRLVEPVARAVLALLDGTRTVDEVARAIAGGLSDEEAAAVARASVELLAKAALLVA
jgi:hypothetical protein